MASSTKSKEMSTRHSRNPATVVLNVIEDDVNWE